MNETGMAAVEAMRQRTEEQMRLRDEMLRRNQEQTASYQQKMDTASQRQVNPIPEPQPEIRQQQKPVFNNEIKSPVINENLSNLNMQPMNNYIEQISQPQFNTAFDVIPLPSEGKLYKNKKPNVKLAYMTTGDENILTSPNLLESGEFLEILINRKLLETDLRYKDLHIGDRNALMIWLRATSYGEMYPVTVFDEDNESFETEVNLNELKVKKLGAEPDSEGYFDFYLPLSKVNIKFKLLTVRDVDEIDELVDRDRKNNAIINNMSTYRLEKHIVEVNGVRDRNAIKDFVQNLRIQDAKKLRDYIDDIESGIELDIEIKTPRGGSIKTFLPLSLKFFWPNFSI